MNKQAPINSFRIINTDILVYLDRVQRDISLSQ